jgi:hypothetical protein
VTTPAFFETLTVSTEGDVLFAEIAAPPMNLLGPELVRDLVALVQQPEADDGIMVLVFSSADSLYFGALRSAGVRRGPTVGAVGLFVAGRDTQQCVAPLGYVARLLA